MSELRLQGQKIEDCSSGGNFEGKCPSGVGLDIDADRGQGPSSEVVHDCMIG